jgi:multimeric flavodoxin WrbA
MKITVICASPNEEKSITYHHMLFLEKNITDHTFEYLFLNEKGQISREENIFDILVFSDLIIFSYPVHTMLVPYRMMLFMKTLLNDPRSKLLIGKNACQYSTSNHFFDNTALKYMKQCFETLKMNTLPGYMAKSEDLLNKDSRKNIVSYFKQMLYRHEVKNFETKIYSEKNEILYPFEYEPHLTEHKEKSFVTLVYNGESYSQNLKNMILAFDNLMPNQIQLIDLSNITLQKNSMRARLRNIAFSTEEKDDYLSTYEEKLSQSKVIIYASDVEDHWFNEKFKIFEDRGFSRTGRQDNFQQAIAFIFVGSLKNERALQEYIEIKSQTCFDAYLGFINNENPNVLLSIESMIQRVSNYLENPYKSSKGFYYFSSSKLFNERNKDIWMKHIFMRYKFFLKLLKITSSFINEDTLMNIIEKQILKPYKKAVNSQNN